MNPISILVIKLVTAEPSRNRVVPLRDTGAVFLTRSLIECPGDHYRSISGDALYVDEAGCD